MESATYAASRALRFRGGGRGRRDGAEQAPGLVLADGAEGLDAAGAEELLGAHAPELAPVVAVGREEDALGALEPEARHGAHGPRRERRVVGPHDLARRRRGGRHHDGDLAEPEQHERAVAPRQVAHHAVREAPG